MFLPLAIFFAKIYTVCAKLFGKRTESLEETNSLTEIKFSYCFFYMNIVQNLLGPKVSVGPWLALRISETLGLGFSKYFRWVFKHFSVLLFKIERNLRR